MYSSKWKEQVWSHSMNRFIYGGDVFEPSITAFENKAEIIKTKVPQITTGGWLNGYYKELISVTLYTK